MAEVFKRRPSRLGKNTPNGSIIQSKSKSNEKEGDEYFHSRLQENEAQERFPVESPGEDRFQRWCRLDKLFIVVNCTVATLR